LKREARRADPYGIERKAKPYNVPERVNGTYSDPLVVKPRYAPPRPMSPAEIKMKQQAIGVPADGIWGPRTDAAYTEHLKRVDDRPWSGGVMKDQPCWHCGSYLSNHPSPCTEYNAIVRPDPTVVVRERERPKPRPEPPARPNPSRSEARRVRTYESSTEMMRDTDRKIADVMMAPHAVMSPNLVRAADEAVVLGEKLRDEAMKLVQQLRRSEEDLERLEHQRRIMRVWLYWAFVVAMSVAAFQFWNHHEDVDARQEQIEERREASREVLCQVAQAADAEMAAC
jgi:hypothetical protein